MSKRNEHNSDKINNFRELVERYEAAGRNAM